MLMILHRLRAVTQRSIIRTAASTSAKAQDAAPAATSSCTEGTVMKGLGILKNKPDPVAMADDKYPEWLWTIGESLQSEKRSLRRARRVHIRSDNLRRAK